MEDGEVSASAETDGDFFMYKLTKDRMVDKEMISEETVDYSEEINDITVEIPTLQYTDVTPREGHAERFEEEDLVAITIQTDITNDTESTIDTSSISKRITLNESVQMQNSALAEVRNEIGPGETGTHYTVFLIKTDDFERYDEYVLEVSRINDEDFGDILKWEEFIAELPYPN